MALRYNPFSRMPIALVEVFQIVISAKPPIHIMKLLSLAFIPKHQCIRSCNDSDPVKVWSESRDSAQTCNRDGVCTASLEAR